jgi:glycosyltransferase involved in cell wall biosynthesis
MATKLLFYTHGLVGGGAERLWAFLASAMKARGFDVIFAQDFEADENRANVTDDIPIFTLGRGHIQAIKALAELLKRERPDVALSAVGGSNTKLLAAKALSGVPVKTIISYHGFNEWRTGLASFATYAGLPYLSHMSDRTVTVSDGLRDGLIRRWHARPGKTVTILNPVFFPADASVPSAEDLARRPEVVLASGRFVPEKDFLTLIRAFARLNRPMAQLVILGKGPDQPKMEALIAKLGVGGRVSLPGYTKEPWAYYANAKCFVLSSKSEQFGNVIVEAMAYGLPVVSTACTGPQEILKHGEFGRIAAVADEFQLARAIAQTLDAPGDPAIRRARADEFSLDVRIPAYEAMIAEVLGQMPVPAPARAVEHEGRALPAE